MADFSYSQHSFVVPCLTANNYDDWHKRMKTYFLSINLWEVVNGDLSMEVEGENNAAEWKAKNNAALSIIQQGVPDSKFGVIRDADTANNAWTSLRGQFRPDDNTETPQAVTLADMRLTNELATIGRLHVYKAVDYGQWNEYRPKMLRNHGIDMGTIVSMFSENLIHINVCRGVDGLQFLRKCFTRTRVASFPVYIDILSRKDDRGNTALCLAAMIGNTKAARIIIDTLSGHASTNNSIPLLAEPDSKGLFPVYIAAMNGHEEMTEYLITQMLNRGQLEYCKGTNNEIKKGVLLLNLLIRAAFYDMAIILLGRYSDLAWKKDSSGKSPIMTFAERPLGGIPVDMTGICLYMYRKFADWGIDKSTEILWNMRRKLVWGKDISGTSPLRRRRDAVTLIKLVCTAVHDHHSRTPEQGRGLSDDFFKPIFSATRLGIYEIVEAIIETCPYIVWCSDEHERTIYHRAVQYRQENIFNLIWNLGADKYRVLQLESPLDGSNILHLAASMKLSPTAYTNQVAGAALQMQRELQWFEAVKELCPVSFQDKAKTQDDKRTPMEMFIDEHTELTKEGETWMKTTATAYSVVTALVITVLFTVTFQLPGGNQGAGIPFFLHKSLFYIFSVADAIGFFSSTTSLMVFLSILTSRYSGRDFLTKLPNKLIFGLLSLFVSIFCMMITFAAGLCLYSKQPLAYAILITVALCIPSFVFLRLQFGLFCGIISSTFGSSIIRQRPKASFRTRTSNFC